MHLRPGSSPREEARVGIQLPPGLPAAPARRIRRHVYVAGGFSIKLLAILSKV